MDRDGARIPEQPMCDRRPDVASPTHHDLEPVQVHGSIVPESRTTVAVTGTPSGSAGPLTAITPSTAGICLLTGPIERLQPRRSHERRKHHHHDERRVQVL